VFKRNKFLLLSVFAHLIVIYVIAQSVMFPSVPDSPAKKPDVIQATLIFELPPLPKKVPAAVIADDEPQATKPEEDLAIAEKPEDSQIEPIAKPETLTTPISPQFQKPEPEPEPEQEEELPEESEQNKNPNENITNDNSTAPIASSEIHAPATSMARRHLNSFQQQQRAKVAEQASRYYQQYKNSPVIDDEVKNPFMTEDDKLRDSLKVRADCSSTSKQTTAVLLGFLGGQIDCSKPPPINSFIQDRINKKSQFPGQHQQKDQKRPQSVVIKKQP
jgi:hypothetical protein